MPFVNGRWVPEDESVATKLNALTAGTSPYIQQARAGAARVATSRGLLNSSIAAGTGESAAITAALPIASQDASQTASKNLQFQGAADNLAAQTQAEGSTRGLLEYSTAAQLAQQQDAQKAAAALSEQNAGQTLTYGTTLAGLDNAATIARQTQAEQATSGLLDKSTAADLQKLGFTTTAQANLSAQEAAQARLLAGENNAAQANLTTAQLAQQDRQVAAAAATQANAQYLDSFNALFANQDIPAATRAQYLATFAQIRDSQLSLSSQIGGVELTWGTPAATDGSVASGNTVITAKDGSTTPNAAQIAANYSAGAYSSGVGRTERMAA